jgi:hypothetical protein
MPTAQPKPSEVDDLIKKGPVTEQEASQNRAGETSPVPAEPVKAEEAPVPVPEGVTTTPPKKEEPKKEKELEFDAKGFEAITGEKGLVELKKESQETREHVATEVKEDKPSKEETKEEIPPPIKKDEDLRVVLRKWQSHSLSKCPMKLGNLQLQDSMSLRQPKVNLFRLNSS